MSSVETEEKVKDEEKKKTEVIKEKQNLPAQRTLILVTDGSIVRVVQSQWTLLELREAARQILEQTRIIFA